MGGPGVQLRSVPLQALSPLPTPSTLIPSHLRPRKAKTTPSPPNPWDPRNGETGLVEQEPGKGQALLLTSARRRGFGEGLKLGALGALSWLGGGWGAGGLSISGCEV